MPGGAKAGHEVTPETRAKISAALKGRKPAWTGKPLSDERKAQLSEAAKLRDPATRITGEAHPDWKGDAASYMAKHNWVRRKKGRAADQSCAHCGGPALHWANVSGEYRRDLDDYVALCVNCHHIYDGHPKAPKRKR